MVVGLSKGAAGLGGGMGGYQGPQNVTFAGGGPTPAQQVASMAQGSPGFIQAGMTPDFNFGDMPQAPDFGGGGGGGYNMPDYGDYTGGMPNFTSPNMPTWQGSMRPSDIQVGDIRFGFEQQNPLKIAGMNLFGQLQGNRLAAYLGQMGERGQMQRAVLQNMLGFGGLDVQRQLGMGNIGANIYGTQAGLYGQLQGIDQAREAAKLQHALGLSGIAQQRYATDKQHELGKYGIDAPHTQRQDMLDRLLGKGVGVGGLLGLGGGGGASSGPVGAASSQIASQAGGPFEQALQGRAAAASAGNAADIAQQRMAAQAAAAGPGGGMASRGNMDPLMAHSRAMADTQDTANLRQQMLGERQLGASLLGSLGGLM